jgi:hypothetical protein
MDTLKHRIYKKRFFRLAVHEEVGVGTRLAVEELPHCDVVDGGGHSCLVQLLVYEANDAKIYRGTKITVVTFAPLLLLLCQIGQILR